MGSVLNFTGDIKAFSERTKIKAATVVRKVVFEIASGVVQMTPVDTGHARANWQVAIGGANSQEVPGTMDEAGVMGLAQNTIKDIKGGEVVYIFNNVPYIQTLEYGDYPNPPKRGTYLRAGQVKGEHTGKGYFQFSAGGFSNQAPAGMARVTLQRVQANFHALAATP